MKLLRFRVTNFRSVEDSEWIDTDKITALIGTNESGKTNLLLPLWKLNPAKDGEINPLLDYPRKRYNEIRVMQEKPFFIEADFQIEQHLSEELSHITGFPKEQLGRVRIARNFSKEYLVTFPDASVPGSITSQQLITQIKLATDMITGLEPLKSEEELKKVILSTLDSTQTVLSDISEEPLQLSIIKSVLNSLEEIKITDPAKRSTIVPRFENLIDDVKEIINKIDKPHPNDRTEAKDFVIEHLPKFVYYSNYGNLDSEIYLPHVIENLQRTDLGPKEEAKTRTLRVLFDFVRLEPEEILELGKDIPIQNGHPTEQQIEETANKKKERTILLQSASTELTTKFRDWWRQGNYIFQFQADGDHFRIWVSDQIRPEPIELESRSSGLQWFLSFYLIFLVESQEHHADSILLLDEPGLSLHPLAQEDLSLFFENLAKTNQLIYTTHSPFMVDSNHLDRVKAVYVEENGETKVSPDLRAREKQPSQSRSIYPVHAALGLSVTDTLFLGCQVVIVEGQSDLFYLSAIKNFLVGSGMIKPQKEIVFVPAGGVRGINAVTPIISGHDERLPLVILDSDKIGKDMAQNLKANLYKEFPDRVISIGELISIKDGEIEDLFPVDFFSNIISRKYREPEESFEDLKKTSAPILSQFEEYAKKHELTLYLGWKVELAKMVKNRLYYTVGGLPIDSEYPIIWKNLFEKILA